MRKFLMILSCLSLAACSSGVDNDLVDPCAPNPCNEPNKTVCTDVDGQAVCSCDQGYELDGNHCVAIVTDPCDPNPCNEPNKTVCTDMDGQAVCSCDEGYVDVDGVCEEPDSDECPAGYSCRADVCVPDDSSDEQCLVDEDCHSEDPDAPTTCNAAAAGGICLGCATDLHCPGAAVCNLYGTCALTCDDDVDCPHGKCYAGYCGQATCTEESDCPTGTTCIDEDQSGSGMCMRIPCTEVACSPTKPDGECSAGSVCLYGACVDSCDPNPCTVDLHRGTCELDENTLPRCVCDEGYVEVDGACQPESAGDCPEGYDCDFGVCALRADAAFLCGEDGDCGAGMSCSNNFPGGVCHGCGETNECPTGFDCFAGYCLRPCESQADCYPGTTCEGFYCSAISCTGADGDCPDGTVCTDTGSEWLCRAIPCQ